MDGITEPMLADLEKLGFTLNESKTYLTLLRSGSLTAGKISQKTGLDRSSTYNALNCLVKKGLVAMTHETQRSIFSANDPQRIVDYFKEKEQVAANVMPLLKSQRNSTGQEGSFLHFKGYRGLKTVFEDILASAKGHEYLVLGSEGQFSSKMPYFVEIFRKRKEQAKISTRIITRQGKEPSKKSKRTEYRAVEAHVASPATINVYGKKVALLLWDSEPEAILIESESLAKTMKSYFEIIWKNSKKM